MEYTESKQIIIDGDDTNSEEKSKNHENVSPIKTKSKSTRRRGLAARLKSSKSVPEELSDHATVYSTKVSKLFGSGSLSFPVNSLIKHDSVKKHLHDEEDTSAEHAHDTPTELAPEEKSNGQDDVQITSVEEDDLPSTPKIAKTTAAIVKSPTPPPPPSPPPQFKQQNKRTRMSKGLKKAIRNICDAKEHLIVEERVTRLASDKEDIICLEDDEDLLPMRIRCGADTYRCPIKKGEPFKRVISEMAEKMNAMSSRILLVLNDRTIHSYDSPQSLGLQVADIVYCHVSSEDRSILEDSLSENNDNIQLYVQSGHSRQKQKFNISRNQSLDEIVRKYSIQTNIDPSHLRLQFDGEVLSLDDTPDELELEDGYCLDMIHLT